MYRSPVTSIPSLMEHFERSSRKTCLLVVLLKICSRGESVVQSLSSPMQGEYKHPCVWTAHDSWEKHQGNDPDRQ